MSLEFKIQLIYKKQLYTNESKEQHQKLKTDRNDYVYKVVALPQHLALYAKVFSTLKKKLLIVLI